MGKGTVGNFKQKNKKFKGESKGKTKRVQKGRVSKIKAVSANSRNFAMLSKKARKNQTIQTVKSKRQKSDGFMSSVIQQTTVLSKSEAEDLKNAFATFKGVKVILLAAFNEQAQPAAIRQAFFDYFGLAPGLEVPPHTIDAQTRPVTIDRAKFPQFNGEQFILLAPPRHLLEVMDCAKVADIVCPVLSAADVNLEKFKADPHAFGGAFDELGLSTISILRAQGIGSTVPIIQDLAKVPPGKRKEVRDVFSLFLTSEFPDSTRVVSLDEPGDLLKLALEFKNLVPLEMNYKQERGQMLVEGLELASDGQHLDLWGVVRGSGFSCQEHLHLTGFGDLEIVGIGAAFNKATLEAARSSREEREETMDEEKPKKQRRESGKKAAKRREDFVAFRSAEGVENFELKESNFDPNAIAEAKAAKVEEDMNKLIEGFRELDIPRNAKLEGDDQMDNEIEEAEEDDNLSYEEYEQNRPLIKNQATIVQVQARPPEEREFEDEVEYPATVSLAEKFQDYRGMKSFRTSVWSKYEAVSPDIAKVHVFENPHVVRSNALKHHLSTLVAFPGMYCRVRVHLGPGAQAFTDFAAKLAPKAPLVLSSLFKWERQVSLCHMRLKLHNENEAEAASDKLYEVHLGFRRFKASMIFSKLFTHCDKAKYCPAATSYEDIYLGSYYGQVYFPPKKALVFSLQADGSAKCLSLSGQAEYPDPFRVILQRVILTGYPMKIHKRRAMIQYMFFNPADITVFRKNEVWTKNGLRGKIEDSVGTQGHMKVLFNNRIKGNDTVGMNLYRRVYPAYIY